MQTKSWIFIPNPKDMPLWYLESTSQSFSTPDVNPCEGFFKNLLGHGLKPSQG